MFRRLKQRWKEKRENRQSIEEFQLYAKQIGDDYDAKMKPRGKGKEMTFEEGRIAFMEYTEAISPVMNTLAYLRQKELLRRVHNSPLEVPEEYWFDTGVPYRRALYPKGITWAEHELGKIWHAKIDFWVKLVVPVAALVISIIALVHKTSPSVCR